MIYYDDPSESEFLPWHQITCIIQDEANKYAPSIPRKQVYMSMTGILEEFGYALWEAFEKVHNDN